MKQRHIDNSYGIFLMWWNWTLSTGILISIIVISLWLKPVYLPLVAFALDIFLFATIRNNRRQRVPSCYLIPFICARALFWSAVVMVIINLMYTHWFVHRFFDPGTINRQIPFITQLIVAPMTLVMALWTYFRRDRLSLCRDCRMRFGTPAERGFLGRLFTQEGRFQNSFLIGVALFSTVATWTYYFLSYVNDELTRTDKLVFVWCTVVLYGLTITYMVFRYLGLWSYYCKKEENVSLQSVTMTELRYIVLWDNFIALYKVPSDSDGNISDVSPMDSPVRVNLSFRQEVTLYDATRHFESMTGLRSVDIKFMYSTLNTNADRNIFHYLCFLTDEQKVAFDRKYPLSRWYTLSDIAGFINKRQAAPLLAAEIVRMHTMAMAWKTYNEEGYRRYKIKHYRPTYRLRDVKNYNLDYNDLTWLRVADNNEDKPLFRLRRFWRKYLNGMNE